MNLDLNKQKVIFLTFSNFLSGAFGDAINDRKLFKAIPDNFDKFFLSPKYSHYNLNITQLLPFLIRYIKICFNFNTIFITRGHKLACLPILVSKIFRNKVIVRLGCTPLSYIEKKAFYKNKEYRVKLSFFKTLINYIELQIEKFSLKYSNRFISENKKVERIAVLFGANPSKIKIIPYYVQKYFDKSENPKYERKKDIFKIGYTGRFKKYDYLEVLIKALILLKKDNFKFELNLIGDGPEKQFYRRLINKSIVRQNVKFLGSKTHVEVSNLIENYHCLVLPMLLKLCPSTISIKILEGVIKGKIIITTNSGNNASLFLKHQDLIINNVNEVELVKKIMLISEYYEKYNDIAIYLSDYHSKIRTLNKFQDGIKTLLLEL